MFNVNIDKQHKMLHWKLALLCCHGYEQNNCGVTHRWSYNTTHIAEMPQWCPAFMPAESNSDRPISEMVGAMVNGPIKRMKRPIRPVNPTST